MFQLIFPRGELIKCTIYTYSIAKLNIFNTYPKYNL